ncbi:TPA: hypothetical protein ACH3X2_008149 [Trebouxia sp. C0005]
MLRASSWQAPGQIWSAQQQQALDLQQHDFKLSQETTATAAANGRAALLKARRSLMGTSGICRSCRHEQTTLQGKVQAALGQRDAALRHQETQQELSASSEMRATTAATSVTAGPESFGISATKLIESHIKVIGSA